MKLKLYLLFIFLSVSYSTKAQISPFFDFEGVYEESFLGVGLGTLKMQEDMKPNIGLAVNINFCGGFLSCLVGFPREQNPNNIGQKIKTRGSLIHAGYQIPFHNRFRIAPLIGYASFRRYGTDESEKKRGMDFGAMMIIDLKNINLYATYTRYGFYVGCSFNIKEHLPGTFPLW
ncbi:hypothetical protein [Porphyromonas sp.]|uniref:hypothetical protein n=1 Tax=Porphyromonas sp. TaxID=1924944 RepID=UPI0026DD64E5|nr:hypothetical protein [Porphyromonas sp.]MDO4695186.1 hypothetical protein [Porphyromonas sp.]MDO4770932.1 hypothetical protein [Porphyromonas sp.]